MKIFVSVVSYRDPLLKHTINSLLDNKSVRHDITIGIFEQTRLEDSLVTVAPELVALPNVKYKRIDPEYADGVCWARDINMMQSTDEDFIYQTDSHMLFDPNWDRKLVNDYKKGVVRAGHDRVIISGNCKNFHMEGDEPVKDYHPTEVTCSVKYFHYEPAIDLLAAHGDLLPATGDISSAIHICAGNFFAPIKWIKEVGVDTGIFFEGEEQLMVMQSFLKGYEIYHPSALMCYHYIDTHNYVTKHWYEPISDETVQNYNRHVTRSHKYLRDYIDSLDEDVLLAFHKKYGVNYIDKTLDESAKSNSMFIETPEEREAREHAAAEERTAEERLNRKLERLAKKEAAAEEAQPL